MTTDRAPATARDRPRRRRRRRGGRRRPRGCRRGSGSPRSASSCSAGGPDVFDRLRDARAEVFPDVKLHDIPTTVGRAARALGRLGRRRSSPSTRPAAMRCCARGSRASPRGRGDAGRPLPFALAVTVLTSEPDASAFAARLEAAVDAGVRRGRVRGARDREVHRVAPRLTHDGARHPACRRGAARPGPGGDARGRGRAGRGRPGRRAGGHRRRVPEAAARSDRARRRRRRSRRATQHVVTAADVGRPAPATVASYTDAASGCADTAGSGRPSP